MIIKDLHPLMEYLRQHPHVGELFTFMVAFLESLPLIGTVIPGTVTMTAVGFLIGTAALPALLTLLIATVGALAGDTIGFAIGYWYNEGLRSIWPFKKYPKWLTLGEDFIHKHGGKSIIIGRFVGPARSAVPMIAGLLQLTWLRFFFAAIPSAALWAIAYTIPGITLGALSREVPHEETTRFLLVGIAIIAVAWFVFWLIQHFFVHLARGINAISDRAWQALSRRPHGNQLISLITNQQDRDDHHQLTLFIFAFISAILFLILLANVKFQTVLTTWNMPIFHLLQSIHIKALTNTFIMTTIMGAPNTIISLALLLTIGLCLKKQWRAATHLLVALILSLGAVFVFKSLSHSPRPQGFHFVAQSSSFPSGHTTLSFVIISFFAFLIAKTLPKSTRWIPYTLATIFISLVAFSRVYLGAHWLTDIIGSLLLALPIFFICIISYQRMPKATSRLQLSHAYIAALIIITLGATWTTAIMHTYEKNQLQYMRLWPTIFTTQNDWWSNPEKYTPLYRANRMGQPFQPFNVQWLGSLPEIKNTLQQSHWQTPASKLALKSALKRFVSYKAEYHMPLLPWLYQDKPPALIMIQHVPHQKIILELRLWQSNVSFTDSDQTLWLGAIDVRLPPKKLLSIKNRSTVSLIQDEGLNQLQQAIANLPHKIVQVDLKEKYQKALIWHGKVLLIAKP